jgi:hypothetical protein
MREQIADRHGQVMIGIHEPRAGGDDSVPVRVRVIGEGDAVSVLEADQPRHRIWTRAVHADHAIMIDCHKGEGRVDLRIHDNYIKLVDGVDRLPIMDRGPAERIHAQLQAGGSDRVHVNDVSEVVDIRQDEVFFVRAARPDGIRERQALHPDIAAPQQFVGSVLNPLRHIGVGRATIGRVVLEATILRRVVRWRDDDAVRELFLAAAIMNEDSPRDDRRGRHAVTALDDCLHIVGGQHFERGALGRAGKRVSVLAHVEWAVGALASPIVADGLSNGQDVRFGEGAALR